MTRDVSRSEEPRSADEFLRRDGATSRHRAEPSMPRQPATVSGPADHRDRLERQAREAAYPQQHASVVFRRVAVVSGTLVAVGGLVMITTTSEHRP